MKLLDGRNLNAVLEDAGSVRDPLGSTLEHAVKSVDAIFAAEFGAEGDWDTIIVARLGGRMSTGFDAGNFPRFASMMLQSLSGAMVSLEVGEIDFMHDEISRRILEIRNGKVKGRRS